MNFVFLKFGIMKFSKMLEWRKFSLPFVCAVFHLLRLNPFRSKRVWLFACWIGKKYDDNSKFLFEHICENHPEIRCIWITRNPEVCNHVKALGYECYTSTSLKGVFWMLRGGVAIMTNGIDDFSPIPLIGGAKIIALWHGVGGFKKIYNENCSGRSLLIKKTVDRFYSWVHRDFSLATSEYTAQRTMEQFNVKRNSIMITGQPRNDLFRMGVNPKEVLKGGLDGSFKRIILYMPTYRVNPRNRQDVVKKNLEDLTVDETFLNYLKQNEILFLVKLHPLTKFKMDTTIPNFKVLGDKDVLSVQHLLMASDCLVTDYSSCCVDYALLKRPIVFFVPDEDEYLSYSSLNDAYSKVVQEKAKTVRELVKLLLAGNMSQTNLLNEIFEDPSIAGTCYSENTYQKICEKCKVVIG